MLDNFQPTVQVTDESIDAAFTYYTFNNEATSTVRNPTYSFRDTGLVFITKLPFMPVVVSIASPVI
ncbi:MAG: hypothetical protein R2795_16635 [Saprospiraceae bacterium]